MWFQGSYHWWRTCRTDQLDDSSYIIKLHQKVTRLKKTEKLPSHRRVPGVIEKLIIQDQNFCSSLDPCFFPNTDNTFSHGQESEKQKIVLRKVTVYDFLRRQSIGVLNEVCVQVRTDQKYVHRETRSTTHGTSSFPLRLCVGLPRGQRNTPSLEMEQKIVSPCRSRMTTLTEEYVRVFKVRSDPSVKWVYRDRVPGLRVQKYWSRDWNQNLYPKLTP